MELLVIILVLVYSVWSEVAKKKQEENVDVDFSELASLDDFFKDSGTQTGKSSSAPLIPQKKRPVSKHSKIRYESDREAVNYDDLPGLTGQVNRDANKKSSKAINYDELPQLTGQVNYDRMESKPKVNYTRDGLCDETQDLFTLGNQSETNAHKQAHPIQMTFDRDSVVKAFVMSEVLQRYDLERIYARIPGFNQPED